MLTKFPTRFLYVRSSGDEKFIRWNTVKGFISEDILDDYHTITSLMAQDVRDKFGEEYDVWEITEEEFLQKIIPKNS